MEGAASAPVSDDDRLFQVWKGSLAVCLGILHKAGRGALAAADSGEVCGALTSLLNGATSAASACAWVARRTRAVALAWSTSSSWIIALAPSSRPSVARSAVALASDAS